MAKAYHAVREGTPPHFQTQLPTPPRSRPLSQTFFFFVGLGFFGGSHSSSDAPTMNGGRGAQMSIVCWSIFRHVVNRRVFKRGYGLKRTLLKNLNYPSAVLHRCVGDIAGALRAASRWTGRTLLALLRIVSPCGVRKQTRIVSVRHNSVGTNIVCCPNHRISTHLTLKRYRAPSSATPSKSNSKSVTGRTRLHNTCSLPSSELLYLSRFRLPTTGVISRGGDRRVLSISGGQRHGQCWISIDSSPSLGASVSKSYRLYSVGAVRGINFPLICANQRRSELS